MQTTCVNPGKHRQSVLRQKADNSCHKVSTNAKYYPWFKWHICLYVTFIERTTSTEPRQMLGGKMFNERTQTSFIDSESLVPSYRTIVFQYILLRKTEFICFIFFRTSDGNRYNLNGSYA